MNKGLTTQEQIALAKEILQVKNRRERSLKLGEILDREKLSSDDMYELYNTLLTAIRVYGDVIGFDDKDFQEMALTILVLEKVEEAKQAALTQEDKTAIASIADVKSTAEAAKAKAEELEPKVTEAKEELEGKITELGTKVNGIHVPDTSEFATKEELKTSKAIGALNIIKKYKFYTLEGHKYFDIYLNKDLLPFKNVKGVKVNDKDATNQYSSELGLLSYDYTNTSIPPVFPVVFTVSDDGSLDEYEIKISLQYYGNESEYVEDKKYIAVSDISTENKLNSTKFKGAKLEDNNFVYNFKISLEQGTNKQIAVAITENSGNECNDIASCLSLNGQFGLFETVEDSTLSTNTSNTKYYYDATWGLKAYPVKVFKLKTPLNPDGQNDTYIVTYHRPVNHG